MECHLERWVIGGMLAMAAIVSSCMALVNEQDNTAIVQMVAKGTSPLAARCAIRGSEKNECALAAIAK